jgi:hypothetical protein
MADLIPASTFVDGELINEAKLYSRVFTPINQLVANGLIGDSGSTVCSLVNSWVSYDSGVVQGLPQYRLVDGWVEVSGCVKNGTIAATIFTLPVGMRPLKNRIFTCASGSGFNGVARLDIAATGAVQIPIYGASGSNAGVSFDNIRFIAEQ